MTRAHLAYDLHRQVAVDAPVDRLGVDLGVDAFGQTGHHGAVDGRESHIAVAEGLHVRLDAAVHSGRVHRAAGCIDRDSAIDGVGIDGRTDLVDLKPAIDRGRVDRNALRKDHGEAHGDVVLADAVHAVVAPLVATRLACLPHRADRNAELRRHWNDLDAAGVRVAPALFDMHFERVALSTDDIDGPVGVANPDALRRLDLPVVVPFGADVAAAAEEVPAFAVAPIHVTERAQRAQAGRQMVFDVASDASEEQPDADDDAEEHAAANDLATPRAPETLDGCGLIQGHVHGHRCYGPSISQVSPRRATARRG